MFSKNSLQLGYHTNFFTSFSTWEKTRASMQRPRFAGDLIPVLQHLLFF